MDAPLQGELDPKLTTLPEVCALYSITFMYKKEFGHAQVLLIGDVLGGVRSATTTGGPVRCEAPYHIGRWRCEKPGGPEGR